MSDTTIVAPATPNASEPDERLAHRGVFQRLFIRPEIGAIIGAVGIWVFFWAVSIPFGTANGTAGVLDFAATLGIMAVAVSVLMIGGEFDLSSGANTGAMGILVILLVKETGDLGGAGLSLWIAIPLSFAVAMGIGYGNGWLVERTALPSFIVTLATFFVLKGAKLGFSKLVVDQIQVGRTDEGHGYEFWQNIFAAEWDRTAHQLGSRDTIYTLGILGGVALVALAVHEMHFRPRLDGPSRTGPIAFVLGLAVAVAGIAVLHVTDGTGGNWLGGAIVAAGTTVALYGYASWRFEPLSDLGEVHLPADLTRFAAAGVLSIAAAIVSALAFDPYDDGAFIFPWTKQGFRATLFLLFVAAGFAAFMTASSIAKRISPATKVAASSLTVGSLVVLAFFIRAESQSVKFRSEAFSVILVVALLAFAWTLLGARFEERSGADPAVGKAVGRLVAAGLALVVIGLTTKLLFTTDAEVVAGVSPAKFSMRVVWFIGFTAVMTWILGRTRFGSWTFAVGGNKEASRQVGVPAARTKTQLFMIVSGAAWLVGMLLAFRLNTIQAATGDGLEFQYIIAAVVGGTLLTGGYGSAFGGAIGAMIISMATIGIPASRWNSDWRFLFLGVILLFAVIANRSIRTKAESLR